MYDELTESCPSAPFSRRPSGRSSPDPAESRDASVARVAADLCHDGDTLVRHEHVAGVNEGDMEEGIVVDAVARRTVGECGVARDDAHLPEMIFGDSDDFRLIDFY